MPVEEGFVDVGGVRTRYLAAGDGPPVLLVHGFGLTADSWRAAAAGLAGSFRVLAPDCLGQGGTDAVALGDRPPQGPIVDHLLGFLDAVGTAEIGLVGSSFGALIAVLLTLQAPDRVSRLVAVSSGSLAMDDAAFARALAVTRRAGEAYFAEPTLERTRGRMRGFFRDPAAIPDWVVEPFAASARRPAVGRFYLEAVDGMARPDAPRATGRLAEIGVPVLVAWGRFDPNGTPEDGARIAGAFADGRLVVFEHSAHVPYIEEPDAFVATVAGFLGQPASPDARGE